jgi:hypothetical protein
MWFFLLVLPTSLLLDFELSLYYSSPIIMIENFPSNIVTRCHTMNSSYQKVIHDLERIL